MEKEESSEEVLNKSDEKEDSFKDDDGGNILDDILNTKVEKIEDDEPSKRGDSAMDDVEDDANDGGDHESLEEHNIETEDILGSDISSEGEESDHGNESDNSDISHNSDSEQEEETEPNSSELGVKTEKSPSPHTAELVA